MLTRLAAGCAVVIGAFAAACWLIGDLSERQYRLDPDQLDYMWRAPDVPFWLPPTAGVIGGGLAIVLARALLFQIRPYRWPVVALVLVGAALGLVGRVTTAGVIGANIGGGLAVLFGLPALAIVLLTSLAAVVALRVPARPAVAASAQGDAEAV